MSAGPIALVGSGEYLPVMQGLESELISGRNAKYVQIPTAAAPEGESSLDYWVKLGQQQAQRMGVAATPVVIRDRSDAESASFADLIHGAGLIYLSGGNPSYLANTLRDTASWKAIYDNWQDGAALAGCSAGAMAIADHIPQLRPRWAEHTSGLGVLPHIRVLPHFDRMFARIPDFFQRFMHVPAGVTIVGIDEETALVGGPTEWEVRGNKSVWILHDNTRTEYVAGSVVDTPLLA